MDTLVATDVLSLGIHGESVRVVINHEIPMNNDHKPDLVAYMHRTGRGGKFGEIMKNSEFNIFIICYVYILSR